MDSGIHTSLHESCLRHIIRSKFDLKNFYPLPYERSIWHCIQANTDLIKKVIDNFDWKKPFKGCETNKQVNILTDAVFDIMSNFIPKEIILINATDSQWINKKVKGLIHEKNLVCKKHFKKNNSDTQRAFPQIQDQL